MVLAYPVALSAQTDVHGLQQALHGKQLGLRNYSADAVAKYRWADGGLASDPVALHGLEVFLDDSVKLKGGKIVFQGNRVTLIRNGTDLAAAGRSPMTLDVDLQRADPAVVIPQLQMALFFPDLDTAIAGLPNLVARMLPASVEIIQSMRSQKGLSCDCYRIFKDKNWTEIEKSKSKYTLPVITKMVNPAYSQEAKEAGVSGKVSFCIHVSDTGRVDEVWLLRPLGFGLDQNAAKSVGQYVFQPALLDGKPVEAALPVDVNFEIF